MARYHISADNVARVCRAPEGQCPLGGRHFRNRDEADFYQLEAALLDEAALPSSSAERKATREQQHKSLSNLMDFGRVIHTQGNGLALPAKQYPSVEEIQYVDLDADGGAPEPEAPRGWEYLRGFTNQYGYNGAIMHESEVIGGGLADHMLENPGDYVAVTIEGYPADSDEGAEFKPVGWGILRRAA